jgi:peptide/nickel transport system permease protein
MIGFILRRVIQAVVVVFFVILIVFTLAHLVPGGPARAFLGPRATSQQIAQFNRVNNYDRPLLVQFLLYMKGLIWHHYLGFSYKYTQSVTSVIGDFLPKTLVLVGISTFLALLIAVPLGILQVVRRNKPIDHVLTAGSFIFYGMPSFLLGTLLILYLAVDVHVFSVEAPQAQTVGGILADPRGLVLPVITLAAITVASFSRYMRSSMMEAMTEDYVRTARAKGAGPRRVLYYHALRNAIIPIITLLGLSIPSIVSGAVITENVFNYPGMGRLALLAALNTDIPLLLGIAFVATLATIVGSLIADILYAVADPRIRYARR